MTQAAGSQPAPARGTLAVLGSIGYTMAACTLAGLLGGRALDRWWGTAPWGTVVLLLAGAGAGFANMVATAARVRAGRRPPAGGRPPAP